MEKKIATSVEVLIKVADFESIRLTKYGESKIEYDSPEEMMTKEDQLNDEVVSDLVRTMRALPSKLGKKTNAVVEIEEKIKTKIPEWLKNGPEPNIANVAQKDAEKSEAKAHAENKVRKQKKEEFVDDNTELNGLFDDSKGSTDLGHVEVEEPNEENQEENKEEKDKKEDTVENIDDALFDDDEDLFK